MIQLQEKYNDSIQRNDSFPENAKYIKYAGQTRMTFRTTELATPVDASQVSLRVVVHLVIFDSG